MMVNSVTKFSFMDVMLSFSTLSPICSDTAIAKWPNARREGKTYIIRYFPLPLKTLLCWLVGT